MFERILLLFLIVLLVLGRAGQSAAAEQAPYRTGLLDPRARAVPAEIQQGVFSDPDKHLEPLVRFLVAGGMVFIE